jgi:hypothetical protein
VLSCALCCFNNDPTSGGHVLNAIGNLCGHLFLHLKRRANTSTTRANSADTDNFVRQMLDRHLPMIGHVLAMRLKRDVAQNSHLVAFDKVRFKY